jgi:hypothetical protein
MTTKPPTPEEALNYANDLAEAHSRATGGTFHSVSPESVAEALGNAIEATRATAKTEDAKEKPRETDIKLLQNTITDISAFSENRFREIKSLAVILLDWLKLPDSYDKTGKLADVLNIIWAIAEAAEDNAACLADGVGCRDVDIDRQARENAQLRAAS